MRRRLLTILLAGVLGLGLPTFAQADESDKANTAIAINTHDGATIVRTAFKIRHVMNDVVEHTNAAVAFASCTDCTTVAIAIQIVLIESNASTIAPTNVALAINELCSLCVTVANALQFVITTDGPVRFDDYGDEALKQIAADLHEIRKQLEDGTLSLTDLQAKIAAMRATIRDVLQNHLIPAKKLKEEEDLQTSTATTPAMTTTTTPAATTTTPTTTTTPDETTPTTTTGVTTTTGP